jgi:hypothetical protein
MSGAIHPLPQYAFITLGSVKKKHRDNFTFTCRLLLSGGTIIFKLTYTGESKHSYRRRRFS